jgi:ATP-binding cassette subfamily C (CFTR/MRP) protein 1
MVESFNWGVRMIADFETGLTGVERLLQYNAIEHEQEIASERRVKVSKHWPRYGKVDFKNVVMRYRPELEPALRGVSFSIKSGSKVCLTCP